MKNNIGYKTISYHFLGWSVFISYELGTSLYVTGSVGTPGRLITSYVLNMAVFYLHLYGLNRLFHHGVKYRYLKTALFVISECTFVLLLKLYADYLISARGTSVFAHTAETGKIAVLNLLRIFYFTGLSTLYWFAGRTDRLQKQATEAGMANMQLEINNQVLETALTKSKNAYLQQQLNPHLLFNTLNFIYSNVVAHSEDASRVVMLLCDIMRFSMEETDDKGMIALTEEIDQVLNLVELNRLRFDHPLDIELDIDTGTADKRIIPLILLTLTENIFKHGDLAGKTASIHISINETGVLVYHSGNFKSTPGYNKKGKHIGLSNTRLRLDSHFPGHYQLDILEDEYYFELTLTIQL